MADDSKTLMYLNAKEIPKNLIADEIAEANSPTLIETDDIGKQPDKRLRIWLAIVYPESLKENWVKMLEDACIKTAISPLHDCDSWSQLDEENNPEHVAGTLKKPHYHLIFRFRGSKSFRQVHEILRYISTVPESAPIPQVPKGDIEDAVLYLIHARHPEKAQYRRSDIKDLNGFDVDRHFRLTREQVDDVCDALDKLVRSTDIRDYWSLWSYCRAARHNSNMHYELWQFVSSHTFMIKGLLDSRRSILRRIDNQDARNHHEEFAKRDAILQEVLQADRDQRFGHAPVVFPGGDK